MIVKLKIFLKILLSKPLRISVSLMNLELSNENVLQLVPTPIK